MKLQQTMEDAWREQTHAHAQRASCQERPISPRPSLAVGFLLLLLLLVVLTRLSRLEVESLRAVRRRGNDGRRHAERSTHTSTPTGGSGREGEDKEGRGLADLNTHQHQAARRSQTSQGQRDSTRGEVDDDQRSIHQTVPTNLSYTLPSASFRSLCSCVLSVGRVW